jgi:hypothetical protein
MEQLLTVLRRFLLKTAFDADDMRDFHLCVNCLRQHCQANIEMSCSTWYSQEATTTYVIPRLADRRIPVDRGIQNFYFL